MFSTARGRTPHQAIIAAALLASGLLTASASAVLPCPPGESPSAGSGELSAPELLQLSELEALPPGARTRVLPQTLGRPTRITPASGWTSSTASDRDGATIVASVNGDQTVVVEMKNGKVLSAKVNGKSVPSSQVKLDGDDVIVTDAQGAELARVKVMPDLQPDSGLSGPRRVPGMWLGAEGQPQPPQAPAAGGGGGRGVGGASSTRPDARQVLEAARERARFAEAQARAAADRLRQGEELMTQPPRVMLGVTLDGVSGPLAEHFGIPEGDATLVLSVGENLPACAAGLRKYDIIIGVDGKTPCPLPTFQEAMRAKSLGDSVTLSVISRGERKDITIKLEKYDPAKLKTLLVGGGGGAEIEEEAARLGNLNPLDGARDEAIGKLLGDKALVLGGLSGDRQRELEQRLQKDLELKMAKLSERLEQLDAQMEKMAEMLNKTLREREDKK